uniref:Nucleophosmin n=1 Tax=Myotis lucifugus TaxID=59463 RepID=G1Q4L3_MYOLU
MEKSVDMDMNSLRPQNAFWFEVKTDRNYHFEMDNNENEHQLSLRMVSLGAGAKYELHIIEAEAMNHESSPIHSNTGNFENVHTAIGFPGGFEITHIVLQLQCDSGTVQINGKHSVDVGEAKSEDEEEEDVTQKIFLGHSVYLESNLPPELVANFHRKKRKLAADEDGDDEEDDDFDEEEAKEKAPIRITPAKNAQTSNQNLKGSKPRSKCQESVRNRKLVLKHRKKPSSVDDIKANKYRKRWYCPKVEAIRENLSYC